MTSPLQPGLFMVKRGGRDARVAFNVNIVRAPGRAELAEWALNDRVATPTLKFQTSNGKTLLVETNTVVRVDLTSRTILGTMVKIDPTDTTVYIRAMFDLRTGKGTANLGPNEFQA